MSSDWPILNLEDCLDALIDYRGKTPEKTTSGIPLVTAKVIKGGRIETPSEFIAAEDYESWMRRGIPLKGDVVMTTEAPLGEVAQLGSEKVALAQRVITLRGKAGFLDSTYLLYLLQTEGMQDQLKSRATGTTVLGIKQSELRKISVTVPPIQLQRDAASVLSALDDRIALLRETNTTLEAIAQALFKSWFVDFEPVRAKQESREPAGMDVDTAALFPYSFEESELGLVPKGWRSSSILDMASLISGGTPKTDRPENWGGGIPWASAKDVSQAADSLLLETERTITQRGLEESATKMIAKFSTVIVARGATTGRMVLFGDSIAMNQTCYALESKLDTPFALYCQLQREIGSLVNAAHGSVFDTITTSTFSQSKVLQPPEPLLIAFEDHVNSLFQKILVGTKSLRILATLRDTLLPRLISGQLRLPDAETLVEEAVS